MRTLTTGDIARYCDVNQRTVIRWLDRGALKGFKLPGRGNNRVRVEDFLSFLKTNEMPVPEDLQLETRPRVLVVDDEPAVGNAIRRALKPLRLPVEVASGGFEAGSLMIRTQPALITLDLSMPGMNGFDVISFVRETPETEAVKILVISALAEDARMNALSLGADAVLSKPFDNHELRQSVSCLLDLPPL